MSVAEGGFGRVLYITHNGLTEPLGRRQVLPYLTGLSARGWRLTVISFEKRETAVPEALARVTEIASAAGILWRPLRYHNRPPVVGTAGDISRGLVSALRLARHADLIHARSTVPALMARLTAAGVRIPWIFDLRGLLAQEYVDAGHWHRNGWLTRLTAAVELKLIRSADGLVTLTRRVVEDLPRPPAAAGCRRETVIPCSVDLDVFRPSESWRREVRSELGWGDEPVLVYSGSLGSWYKLGEMLDFFETARRATRGLRFLLLTPQTDIAEDAARLRGLAPVVSARKLAPDAVPRHLAACDAGICFLGRHASKIASSPTKYGEYLAAGLPVITNGWIGDAAALAHEKGWILVDDFGDAAYSQATTRLARLLATPASTRASARELAKREFALETAIDRYDALYRRVLAR